MALQSMLNQLMTSGRDLLARGEDMAADRIGAGDDPKARGQMRNAAMGGAAATAVLGLLLGTKSGRSIASTGVMAGGLGYLGKLAYDAYRKQSGVAAQAPDRPAETPVGALEGPAAEGRAHALLAAMIAAAKADGHIDADERRMIDARMAELGSEDRAALQAELDRPLDARAIAAMAEGDQARREMYAMSALVCRADHPMERAWLDSLAAALGLPEPMKRELESRVAKA